MHRVLAAAGAHERQHGQHRHGTIGPALCAFGDVEPDQTQERDHRENHRRRHLKGVLPPHTPVQHPGHHGHCHSCRHRQQRLGRVLGSHLVPSHGPHDRYEDGAGGDHAHDHDCEHLQEVSPERRHISLVFLYSWHPQRCTRLEVSRTRGRWIMGLSLCSGHNDHLFCNVHTTPEPLTLTGPNVTPDSGQGPAFSWDSRREAMQFACEEAALSSDALHGTPAGARPSDGKQITQAPGRLQLVASGRSPSCCIMPSVSVTPHSSTTLPSSNRSSLMVVAAKVLPVPGIPINAPKCVPRIVIRTQTRSPASHRLSIDTCASGKASNNATNSCFVASRPPGILWLTYSGLK